MTGGGAAHHAPAASAAGILTQARLRLAQELDAAEARVVEGEVAMRLAAETPLQRQMREAMGKHVHQLSGVFASADADGDGAVTRVEFRRVLPVLQIDGATEADADALYYILSRGAEEIGYRDLFLELSKASRQAAAAGGGGGGAAAAPPAAAAPSPPPSRKGTPRKVTPRSASATKERPAAAGGAKAATGKPAGRAGSAPRAGGRKPIGRK